MKFETGGCKAPTNNFKGRLSGGEFRVGELCTKYRQIGSLKTANGILSETAKASREATLSSQFYSPYNVRDTALRYWISARYSPDK